MNLDPESLEWLLKAEGKIRPCSRSECPDPRVLCRILDDEKLVETDRVEGGGIAVWRVLNFSKTRRRRVSIHSKIREGSNIRWDQKSDFYSTEHNAVRINDYVERRLDGEEFPNKQDWMVQFESTRPEVMSEASIRSRLGGRLPEFSSEFRVGTLRDDAQLEPASNKTEQPGLNEDNSVSVGNQNGDSDRGVSNIKSKTLDADLSNLLIASSPVGWNNLFFLGCFDPRITFVSQQARALNLVRALILDGRISSKSKVAVVGGGVSGVTAALAISKTISCEVKVFEEHRCLLPLQDSASHRFLHPHIYDWPSEDLPREDAGLPILNWKAGYAHEVVSSMRDVALDHLGEEVVSYNCVVNHLDRNSDHTIKIVARDGEFVEDFDVVILASGFGIEKRRVVGVDVPSYWSGDDLDSLHSHRKIFVVGSGDGGLIDLARASLSTSEEGGRFRHDEAIALLHQIPEFSDIAESMSRIEASSIQNFKQSGQSLNLFQEYKKITIPPQVENLLRNLKRADTDVTFGFANTDIFNHSSSLMSRLFAMLLLRLDIVGRKYGRVEGFAPLDSSDRVVPVFTGQPEASTTSNGFDKVVLRLGPDRNSLFSRFPNLEDGCEKLRGVIPSMEIGRILTQQTSRWYVNGQQSLP